MVLEVEHLQARQHTGRLMNEELEQTKLITFVKIQGNENAMHYSIKIFGT